MDIRIANHGSLFTATPVTDAGRDWIDENVGGETQWWCGGLVVEHRFIDNLVDGMVGDGLEVV